MARFQTCSYECVSEKLPRGARVRFALVADLHGFVYGEGQRELLEAIISSGADFVICAGDLVLRNQENCYQPAKLLMEPLCRELPVYLGLGNHETRLREVYEGKSSSFLPMAGEYGEFIETLRSFGVVILDNERARCDLKGRRVEGGEGKRKKNSSPLGEMDIAGFTLDHRYFHKPFPPRLPLGEIKEALGDADGERLEVLIAHNPMFAGTYLDWGADLILCGHYHGGIMRLWKNQALISPYFHPLPRYSVGEFHRGSQRVYVSPGLGEHSVPIRIHNPRQLFIITVRGKEEDDGHRGKA